LQSRWFCFFSWDTQRQPTMKKPKATRKPKKTKEERDIEQAIRLFLWADSHNWDDGHEELNRILKWKTCDLGTVALIYWRANPEYYRQYKAAKGLPKYQQSEWRFIHKLEKQLVTPERPEVIRFDPMAIRDGYDDLKDKFVRELPPEVYQVTPGIYDAADILSGAVGPLALSVAVSKNDATRLQSLIDEGGNIDFCGGSFVTPLITAVNNKSIELIELILDNGADVNISSVDNESALHRATDIKIAKLLIDNGADIDGCSFFGTIIHNIAGSLSNRYEDGMLEFLLEKGATPDIQDLFNNNCTALHDAASIGDVKSLKSLIQAGWNKNRVDNQGCTALHHAVSDKSSHSAADKLNRGPMVEELVKLGLSPDKENRKGESARTLAAKNAKHGMFGSIEVEQILSVLEIKN